MTYADDFVILSRGHAEEALAWTRRVMTRLGLTAERSEDLRARCAAGALRLSGLQLRTAPLPEGWSLVSGSEPVAEERATPQGAGGGDPGPSRNQAPWGEVRDRLNQLLRGWAAYFSYGTRLMAYRAVDNHVYDRVRGFLTRRHKVPSRGTRRFSDDVVFGNAGRAPATPGAHWRAADSCEVKPVGKPDAGNPHVRFDERGEETGRSLRHRASPRLYVRPDGAYHQWRKDPPRELSIGPGS